MRAVIQRVSEASVSVADEIVGRIGPGFVVFVAVTHGDTTREADALAEKVIALRVFSDGSGKMNRSLGEVGGAVLVVSQFTLAGDASRGRRPSFTRAAPASVAEPLVDHVVEALARSGVPTATGEFGAQMQVAIVNDGPVTLILDIEDGAVR